jgi:multimeric flavodoxin WrbA
MDRLFYSASRHLAFKPAAAVLNARRAGNTASFDVMNKYFTITSMPVVSSTYWNHTHGREPEDVARDLEGIETMRNIGKNMAWLMKCIELGKANGLDVPINKKVLTDFIR